MIYPHHRTLNQNRICICDCERRIIWSLDDAAESLPRGVYAAVVCPACGLSIEAKAKKPLRLKPTVIIQGKKALGEYSGMKGKALELLATATKIDEMESFIHKSCAPIGLYDVASVDRLINHPELLETNAKLAASQS